MSKSLVIVESPAKARTIAAFLGDSYVVESSIGHIRDLPRSASDVPPELKKEAWARLGVDVDDDFKPLYIVDPDKRQHIKKLKQLLREADELLLATDEDREGESIAWHLLEVLEPKVPVKRMVFHEITKKAIQHAIEHPREIDRHLVDAQEARRILDRLYGYEVSPVLWKKVMPKLSAGRVQSVATRIIVERERARMRFRVARYWDIEGALHVNGGEPPDFTSTLVALDGKRLATGRDFGEDGKLTNADALHLDETAAKTLAAALGGQPGTVRSVEAKPYRRSPAAPFMTSTLQQEAGRKLRFSAQRTMKAAQRLYENGYITYMRTDSTTLSSAAIDAARSHIGRMYGADYLPNAPRTYKNKVKNAQEAHEAIRPAGDQFRMPDEVAREVGPDEAKVYELVWKRTVASQMEDARGESVQVRIEVRSREGRAAEFAVSGNTITFPGFLRAYVEGSDDPDAELENREKQIPKLVQGQALESRGFEAKPHETQAPARFTEASLVRRLEELGVGRPSTYASIIETIQDRGYVFRKGTALVPSFKAFAVVGLLERHFEDLVDYAFTAKMEDDLDAIARGDERTVPWLRRFYFGVSTPANENDDRGGLGLRAMVSEKLSDIDARAVNTIPIGRDEDGVEVAVRVGRYGPYLQRAEQTVSIPEDLAPDQISLEKALELLSAPSGDTPIGADPASGLPVFVKAGRFGAYVQLGSADDGEKPKTASLLRNMTPDAVSLEDALRLLSLPRAVGVDPNDGEPILANNGRYGPYIAKGKEYRSLEGDEQIFTVTLDQALALFAQPKRARARAAAAPPLKELGTDAVSGKPITLRQGRFGPYVTDGDTHASLRTGDDLETITPERAQELLQARRERGPSTKKKRGGRAKAAPASSSKEGKTKSAAAKRGRSKAVGPSPSLSSEDGAAAARTATAKSRAKSKAGPAKSNAKAASAKSTASKKRATKTKKKSGASPARSVEDDAPEPADAAKRTRPSPMTAPAT